MWDVKSTIASTVSDRVTHWDRIGFLSSPREMNAHQLLIKNMHVHKENEYIELKGKQRNVSCR